MNCEEWLDDLCKDSFIKELTKIAEKSGSQSEFMKMVKKNNSKKKSDKKKKYKAKK